MAETIKIPHHNNTVGWVGTTGNVDELTTAVSEWMQTRGVTRGSASPNCPVSVIADVANGGCNVLPPAALNREQRRGLGERLLQLPGVGRVEMTNEELKGPGRYEALTSQAIDHSGVDLDELMGDSRLAPQEGW